MVSDFQALALRIDLIHSLWLVETMSRARSSVAPKAAETGAAASGATSFASRRCRKFVRSIQRDGQMTLWLAFGQIMDPLWTIVDQTGRFSFGRSAIVVSTTLEFLAQLRRCSSCSRCLRSLGAITPVASVTKYTALMLASVTRLADGEAENTPEELAEMKPETAACPDKQQKMGGSLQSLHRHATSM